MKTYKQYIEWAGLVKYHDYMSGAMIPKAPGEFAATFIYNKPLADVMSDIDDVVDKLKIKL